MTIRNFYTLLFLCLVVGFTNPLHSSEGKFIGAKPTVYPDWFKQSFLDIREDVEEAASEDKRIMLLFHQDGCPYCNLLVERNLSQKDIEDALKASFDVVEVNMWGDREVTGIDGTSQSEKDFSASLRVQFTPTILFFDEQGRVVLRLNGYIAPEKFMAALKYVSGQMESKVSFRDYLAKGSVNRSSGKLLSEPFFSQPPYDFETLEKPLAVFFEQKHCPSCEKLHKEVLSSPAVQHEITPFHSVQLDMWSAAPVVTPDGKMVTAREWAKSLNITYAPSIVLFNREGMEVIRAEAYFKQFHTGSIFDYVASGAYRKEPNFQRFLTERVEHIRATGKDVNIWQ